MSYPGNANMPPIEDLDTIAGEYIRAVAAGASIVHHHGIHYLEHEMQADGRRLSRIDFDGWKLLTEKIRDACDPIVQFGIASARLEEKFRLMELRPEMMSYAFNVHDEYFRPDPAFPANEMYALHPRDELEEFCRGALEHGVKTEVECFYTGAFWNLEFIRRQGHLKQAYTTLFLGWPGGTWTPPTEKALIYMVDHLPPNCVWNVSVMNPQKQWDLLSLAVSLGGHVRVGYEDNPYMAPGELAKNNAVLVERMVRIAQNLGRDIATPKEARKIIGLARQ